MSLLALILVRTERLLSPEDAFNEVAPGPDGDEWNANVGARLLYKLCGWTLHRPG